ncbi:hypothetical protein I3843_16G017300 [Carya illinoinensis]|nr:hypothetical protein I3843_16G015900 [Carya illinoinensis]KAG7941022.1 hypothetical protein I3843_16G017300 [Carya illinoinensis]
MVNDDVSLMYQFMQNLCSVNATDSILPISFSTRSAQEKLCELGVYGDFDRSGCRSQFHFFSFNFQFLENYL